MKARMKRVGGVLGAVVFALLVAACGGGGGGSKPPMVPDAPDPAATVDAGH
jgi:hypothetical protein